MINILDKRPPGYTPVVQCVPLVTAKAVAERNANSIVVNRGEGKYSVLIPVPKQTAHVNNLITPETVKRLKRLIGETD